MPLGLSAEGSSWHWDVNPVPTSPLADVLVTAHFSFQPVLNDWYNKGHGMCYPVCGRVHIKEPLLLIRKSSPCGGMGFLSQNLNGPSPYVSCHITINKMCWVRPRKFDVLIFSVGQAKMFGRLVCQTTMRFCPSDSIYLKANTLLGMGLIVIQSQPSWSCITCIMFIPCILVQDEAETRLNRKQY